MTKGFKITFLKNGTEIGSTVVTSLEGEIAEKVLNNLPKGADDYSITEGSFVPHPQKRGATVFTAN